MKILLAEDEKDLSRALQVVLSAQGFQIDAVYDGAAAVDMASKNTYDCMIFDIMMPVMDGMEALKIIRGFGDLTPVLMLTAKAEIDDRVEGLDAGADDYLTKPFAMKELIARIHSLARRSKTYTPSRISVGDVTLDLDMQEISCGNTISLAKKETQLMQHFLLNPGKEFSTKELFDRFWQDEPDTDEEIVWIYISYLRQKLLSIKSKLQITGEKGGSFSLQLN